MSMTVALQPLVWGSAILSLLVLVWWLASSLEFDRKFSQFCCHLTPHDLKDNVYSQCLGHRLTWREVREMRNLYIYGSVLVLPLVAGSLACLPRVNDVAGQIVPPIIFATINESAGGNRWLAVSLWMGVIAVVLHAAPLVSTVARKTQISEALPHLSPEHPNLKRFVAFCVVQQYVLELAVLQLIRFDDSGDQSQLTDRSTKLGLIKHAFAQAVLTDDDENLRNERIQRVDREYQRLPKNYKMPVGKPASVLAGAPHEIAPEEKVEALINYFGIPETRERLHYRTDRKTVRTGNINVMLQGSISDAAFSEAWLVDAARPGRRAEWNDFLLKILSAPQELQTKVKDGRVTITAIDGRPIRPRPLVCLVKRSVYKPDGTLYVACRVQSTDVRRFKKLLKTLMP